MANHVRFLNSIHKIGANTWQQLLNPDSITCTDYPFLKFEFLAALEDCQCVDSPTSSRTLNSGWIPQYAVLENEQSVLAIAPVFIKRHSYGEYVFDWSWAEAYEQHGLKYYPKLVWAIPFTPSTGPRMVSQGNPDNITLYHQQIAQGLSEYCQSNRFSGWHCLFPNVQANEALSALNSSSNHATHAPLSNLHTASKVMLRQSCQFHWFNNDFKDFSHYLEKFTSRKRKNIKKERSKLKASGFIFEKKVANNISAKDIEIFYHCYQLTYVKRKSRGYLTLEFFKQVLQTMPDQLLLVQGIIINEESGSKKIVASALYFKDSNNLYGRYWGCLEEFDSLHFECCYYQGIDYCIENNLSHFDPGTQGEHKISRGFEPTICNSQHWISHPQFSDAIDNFINDENNYIQRYVQEVVEHLPFKELNEIND